MCLPEISNVLQVIGIQKVVGAYCYTPLMAYIKPEDRRLACLCKCRGLIYQARFESDRSDPYIKSNSLLEMRKVLGFELWFLSFRFTFLVY